VKHLDWLTMLQADTLELPPSNGGRSFEGECVRFFADVVHVFGMPRSVGQIYGLLYASPNPMGFVDIVERLEISKGSASQGLQVLRSLGAINEAPGGRTTPRRDGAGKRSMRFEPETSLRRLVTGVLRERMAPLAASSSMRLEHQRRLAEQAPRQTKFYVGRVRQLARWRRRFTAVLPLLVAVLGPQEKLK
jgi:hypothetical protein